MSYSICLNCKEMVRQYEKYCDACERQHNLKNDKAFWKTNGYDYYQEPLRSNEIAKDRQEWEPS